MAKSKAKKIIQVPIEDDLLARIDATAGVVAESRAAFIREACKHRLKSLQAKELDRLYVEGYRKRPEELDWAEASVKLLSKRLPLSTLPKSLIRQRVTALSAETIQKIDEAIRFALDLN